MERCDHCGFTYDESQAWSAGTGIISEAGQIAAMLQAGHHAVAMRPDADTWSPLEYGCHVRDVLLVQRERVLEARRVDRPQPAAMGRDERAVHDAYAEQDPVIVARQLADATLMFVHVLDRLGDDWDRTLVYNYPEPAERSLRWVAVHTLHEVTHHDQDIRRQLT